MIYLANMTKYLKMLRSVGLRPPSLRFRKNETFLLIFKHCVPNTFVRSRRADHMGHRRILLPCIQHRPMTRGPESQPIKFLQHWPEEEAVLLLLCKLFASLRESQRAQQLEEQSKKSLRSFLRCAISEIQPHNYNFQIFCLAFF